MLWRIERKPIAPRNICPADGSLEALLHSAEAHTDRPIVVTDSLSLPLGVSGMWVLTPTEHRVLLAANASPLRREATLCHELGHILLGHRPGPDQDPVDDSLAALFPDLHPSLLKRMMYRCGYNDQAEREAETFATALLDELYRARTQRRLISENRYQ